jgi:predicted membrane protein
MRDQGQVVLAMVIILVGVVLLIGNVFDVDVWALCWPVALILLGLWVLLRPRMIGADTIARQKLLGNIRRRGEWQVMEEEFWIGIGDVKLDMTEAEIPAGETQLRIWNFVGDVRLTVPPEVGVSVSSSAFIADVRVLGRKRDSFLAPVRITSENYETAERKIKLETTSFIADVRVWRAKDD